MIYSVLLHGFPDRPDVWNPLLEHFPASTKVLVPNLWEYGTENGKAIASEVVAAKIFHQLRKMGFDKDDELMILGHDLGAAYAIALSRLAPDQTTLTILNGLSPQMLLARMNSGIQALKSWYIWLMQMPILPKSLFRFDKKLPSRLAKIAHRPSAPDMCRPAEMMAGLEMYRKLFREGVLHPTQKPVKVKKVIVIWGIQDPFLNTPTELEFAPLAHEVEIHLLNDHHWPQLHSPKEIAEIIDVHP